MNLKAFLNTISNTARTLPIVILYVTEGCNLKCVTCSYRSPLPGELTFDEIASLAKELSGFGLKHIVYSGGEPLLRRDFDMICEVFACLKVKQTLLTNGLLLEKRIDELRQYFTEVIVSIDGAKAETHNKIRGVNSFDLILKGIAKALEKPSEAKSNMQVSIRTVIQKQNFRELPDFIELAKSIGVKRISFLSADVSSDAYGRDTRGAMADESEIALNSEETDEFKSIIERVISDYKHEFETGFISESPGKMYHMAEYYKALQGRGVFPRNYCNAPMVSAVITSTGEIHPCFFLPSFGNIRKNSFKELISSHAIKNTRKQVRSYELERCQKCVCTLYTSPKNALLNNF